MSCRSDLQTFLFIGVPSGHVSALTPNKGGGANVRPRVSVSFIVSSPARGFQSDERCRAHIAHLYRSASSPSSWPACASTLEVGRSTHQSTALTASFGSWRCRCRGRSHRRAGGLRCDGRIGSPIKAEPSGAANDAPAGALEKSKAWGGASWLTFRVRRSMYDSLPCIVSERLVDWVFEAG